jgi:hypothetical protein
MLKTAAIGTPLPNYQWLLNQTILPEATNATLVLSNIQVPQAGAYSVLVSNYFGARVEAVARVEVDASLLSKAENGFESDAEGWGVLGSAETPLFHSTSGNPGGYISATNRYWLAPEKYLGNQSAVYGGVLQFDLKQSDGSSQQDDSDIILTGQDLNLFFKSARNPGTNWTSYKVALHELAGWKKDSLNGSPPTQTEMLTVLATLTSVSIRGQSTYIRDIGGLDNVVLLAPPTNNVVLLLARPRGGQTLFEWPATNPTFQLQGATALSPPNWADVISTPTNRNGLNTLLIPFASNGQFYQFYRLKKL